MEEWKIGEIRQVNGEWYQCVVAIDGCRECSFRAQYYCALHSECSSDVRSDGISVIFKKLEKVGEPTILMGKMVQEFKNNNDNHCEYCCFNKDCHPLDIASICDLHNSFFVEIKQTKEDMEEYRMYDAKEDIPEFDKVVDKCLFGEDKLNLKPFDLEAAKVGKPVCTRDGRKARIVCFDKNDSKSIVALIQPQKGSDIEVVMDYHNDGKVYERDESTNDLMMLPEKKEGWVNVYKRENEYICENECCVFTGIAVFKSEGEAKRNINKNKIYLNTIKINWGE